MDSTIPEYYYSAVNPRSDIDAIHLSSDCEIVRLSLVSDYQIETNATLEARIISGLGCESLSPLCEDILDVVRFVYAADCRSPRPTGLGQWARKITLVVPVRVIDAWNSPKVATLLAAALRATGGDEWEIKFVARDSPYWVKPTRLFDVTPNLQRVCLLSEGLDSASGIVREIAAMSTHTLDFRFIAVTALMQTQVEARVKSVVATINNKWRNSVLNVFAPIYRNSSHDRSDEATQRTRSLLLLGLGAVVAITIGTRKVEIFENGIEMFNFPLSPVLSAQRFSKAMHPVVLARTSAFFAALLGEPFQFEAPFTFETKSDLLSSALPTMPDDLLQATISCMHWPQRRPGPPVCGMCFGCLYRRIAFVSTKNIDPSDSQYRNDFRSDDTFAVPVGEMDWPSRQDDVPNQEWEPVYQMDMRMHLLGEALDSRNPKRALRALIGLTIAQEEELFRAVVCVAQCERQDVDELLLDLMQRYYAEWQWVKGSIPALTRSNRSLSDLNTPSQCDYTRSEFEAITTPDAFQL